MEKKKPHYPLSEVQRVVEDRGVNAFTATALVGVAALSISSEQAVGSSCGFRT
jgi:motility quorum-sensing regulator / GCU-specific mRNA interferase toxin